MPAKRKKEWKRKDSTKQRKLKKLHPKSDEQKTDIETEAAVGTTEETTDIGDTEDATPQDNESIRDEDMSDDPSDSKEENDGLRMLKTQTEDMLITLRGLKFIPTQQAEEAKKLLEGKGLIVIRGNPGEGKTTTALHLIDNDMYKDKRVVIYSLQDWKTVDTELVDIVVLENIFGNFDLDSGRLQLWMVYLPSIQEHVDTGRLQVIITTRDDILSKAYSKLESLKHFPVDLTLTLSSKQLNDSEKIGILNRQLQRKKKTMKEDEKEKCIANFSGLVGFPQCCLLFAGNNKLFDRGPEFFKSPSTFFVGNIAQLEATGFLSLAFLFCNGEIFEENLSPEAMPEQMKIVLMELASSLGISKRDASITLARDPYNNFLELYVVKYKAYDSSLESVVEKSCIKFAHSAVYVAVGKVLGGRCPEMFVKYADSEYLYQTSYTAINVDYYSENVFIRVSVFGLLAKRMIHDVVKGGPVGSLAKHSCLKRSDYLNKLKCELQNSDRVKDFFLARYISLITGLEGEYFICSSINSMDSKLAHSLMSAELLSEGTCFTFMQYILQNDEELVTLVYIKLLEFLQCAHTNNRSVCWKCVHKQELLELSLYYHHFEIADKLIHMDTCYTHVSLCNAAKQGALVRVQTILKALKRSQVFNPGCDKAKYALFRAYISGNHDLIEILLREGIILDSLHVVDALKHGDMNVLMKIVEHLRSHNKWNPLWEPYRTHWNFGYLHELHTRISFFKRRKRN